MLLLSKESGRRSAPLLAILLFESRADTSGSYRLPDGNPYPTNLSSPHRDLPATCPPAPGTRRRTAPLPPQASTSTNRTTGRCTVAGYSANFPNSAPVPVYPAQETTALLRREYIVELKSPPASGLRSLSAAGCVASKYTNWRRQILAPLARNPVPSRSEPPRARVAQASPIPAHQSSSQRSKTPSPDSLAAAKKPALRTANTTRAKPNTTPPIASRPNPSNRPDTQKRFPQLFRQPAKQKPQAIPLEAKSARHKESAKKDPSRSRPSPVNLPWPRPPRTNGPSRE